MLFLVLHSPLFIHHSHFLITVSCFYSSIVEPAPKSYSNRPPSSLTGVQMLPLGVEVCDRVSTGRLPTG
jgi:hypothetical protein